MSTVVMFAVVSLDGFIAFEDDTVGPLFDFYGNGDVPVTFSDESRVFHTTQATADFLNASVAGVRCTVVGRTLFDFTNGWEGVPPSGDHVFVVTHRPADDWAHRETAPFTFVGDVGEAVDRARAHAGDGLVSLTAGDVGGQALRLGLVDQVALNVVPVVLGRGKPFFGTGEVDAPIVLENPTRVVEGDRVLHLLYDVR